MGFLNTIGSTVRGFFAKDKDKAALQIAASEIPSSAALGGRETFFGLGYDTVSEYLRLDPDLMTRYRDSEEMDDYPELAQALNIYADDATQPDTQMNKTVWVTSTDRNIERMGNTLFNKTLRMDDDTQGIARSLCKYGSDFEEVLVTGDGVVGLHHLPAPTMRRVEGPRGELYGFYQDYQGGFKLGSDDFRRQLAERMKGGSTNPLQGKIALFEDWEVVHFRLRGKARQSVYGHSVLEPARWIYKRLAMLEDSAFMYRFQRSPERLAFYIDTGQLPPAESRAYLKQMQQQFRKKKFIDPLTGKLIMRPEQMAQDEDFFIATRNGQDGTRVEVLGSPQWQSVEDIEYFRSKMFSAINVPKAYLNQDENTARAVLSSEDVRFARSVLRVQRELRNGFSRIFRVHLAALNLDPYVADYDVCMAVPSSVFELAQIEVRNARADLALRMKEFVSMRWILTNVFSLSDDAIDVIFKEREEDAKREGAFMGGMDPSAGFGAPGVPGGPNAAPAGAEGSPESNSLYMHRSSDVQRMIQESRRPLPFRRGSGSIKEQEMSNGDKGAEKRANAKLDRILSESAGTRRRLREISGLLQDLSKVNSSSVGSRR